MIRGLPATSLFSNVRSYDPYRISDDKIHRQDSVQASGSFHQYSVIVEEALPLSHVRRWKITFLPVETDRRPDDRSGFLRFCSETVFWTRNACTKTRRLCRHQEQNLGLLFYCFKKSHPIHENEFSLKAVEKSSEKICYTKHKSENSISRLLLLLSAPKKIEYIINTACERYIENAMKHRFHSWN